MREQAIRDGLVFRYFFDAGLNKETMVVDGEGSDVYELDDYGGEHWIGNIYGYTPSEILDFTDSEFDELLAERGIFSNL